MIDINKRVIEVLEQTHLMSLGICDNEEPWVADVIFIHDGDMNLYWMSDPEARHSVAISKKSKVAGSITQSTKKGEFNFGIQFEGNVSKLEGIQFKLLVQHLAKRGYAKPDISQATRLLDGDCWYKIVPTKIYLIDERNFGYDRQTVFITEDSVL